jgi:hypothetical protein
MKMDVKQFWADCRARAAGLPNEVQQLGLTKQPSDGTVYIASTGKPSANGVCLCDARLAGQRLNENTHRLATDKEVESFLAEQVVKAKSIQAMEMARRQVSAFGVTTK